MRAHTCSRGPNTNWVLLQKWPIHLGLRAALPGRPKETTLLLAWHWSPDAQLQTIIAEHGRSLTSNRPKPRCVTGFASRQEAEHPDERLRRGTPFQAVRCHTTSLCCTGCTRALARVLLLPLWVHIEVVLPVHLRSQAASLTARAHGMQLRHLVLIRVQSHLIGQACWTIAAASQMVRLDMSQLNSR